MPRRTLLLILLVFTPLVVGALLLGRGERSPVPRVPPVQRADGAGATPDAAGSEPAGGVGAVEVPEQVHVFLRNGQAWRAARLMREFLARRRDPEPAAVLLAARAEAEWGGWARVRSYLEGAPWLDAVEGGEGWFWLARALEEGGETAGALAAYERYLASPGPDERDTVARLRRALLLLRAGEVERGSEQLGVLREAVPELAPRLDQLAAESLAARGDTAGVRRLLPRLEQERGERVLLAALEKAGNRDGARELALALRRTAESATARTELAYRAGRLALATGDTALARRELRAAVGGAEGSAYALRAATLLVELGPRDPAERLALARVLDRHGRDRQAAAGYRAWLDAEAGTPAERSEVRMRMGRALFAAGEYAAAVRALEPLTSQAAHGAEALHLTGRAQYRRGQREQAFATFERLAERFPRSGSAAEGLFLIADLSHDAGNTARARRVYRRVASEFPGTDRAGLSLMRLGGMAFLEGEHAAAARAWEEYRESYPRGERWLEATYWAGRAYEAAGDREAAQARFRAIRERDPLSYYALLASERLEQPFWPIPMGPAPAENPAARERVSRWLDGVELLRRAGLHAEAEAEVDRLVRRAGDDDGLLYPLAEALNEHGYTLSGIRIGQRLQRRESRPNPRLLRILYPFPYRALVEAEAREKGLDPFVVAALTRQESLFKARITSPVGARGLMQIMPETGRLLARAADIERWDAELLYHPEINVHLGTRYLAEQMRRYDGSLPSVFSAYNAGPHRIDRWMEFPEFGRDAELFTERIPYRETRDYVKILTRNIALYQALYGE